jgi:hypothetical protein
VLHWEASPEVSMLDLVFVAATVVSFAALWALVRACDRL